MTNEILFLTTVIFDLVFVVLSLRFGKAGVISTIVVNIILVNTFGNKLISLFGYTTNSGNVFYACVFLAINILAEHYKKKDLRIAIWIGFLGFMMYVLLGQFTIRSQGLELSAATNVALTTVFKAAPQIAFASIVAYLCSQYTNAFIYEYLHQKDGKKRLWFRNGAGMLAGQIVDSILFFTIAFYDQLTIPLLMQTMLLGFVLKVLIGIISTPLLYLSYIVKVEE